MSEIEVYGNEILTPEQVLKAHEESAYAKMRGGYMQDHPTHFNWTRPVKRHVRRVQLRWPWRTYINTYDWHPPYNYPIITKRYDALSFDVWGGGMSLRGYTGYRGKTLPRDLGNRIFKYLWNTNKGPLIHWIIWDGRMWIRGRGWSAAPGGPIDSDPGHYKHIHVTYLPN